MTFDIDKPLSPKEETLFNVMERTAKAVEELLEIQKPGVHGIEGTESVPECTIDTFDLAPNQRWEITGNRRRKALRVYVSPIQYGGVAVTDAVIDISDRRGWDAPGRAIVEGDEFCLFDSTNAVFLRALDKTGAPAANPVTVTVVQENS